jgi:hypothetical protein
MTTYLLDQAIVANSALRSVNFFNGRLLTGGDLQLEQSTNAARLARLGRLIGGGVAYGLEVSTGTSSTVSQPVVTVAAGLAVTPAGDQLELPAPIDLSLYPAAPVSGAEPGGLFAACQPFAPGTYSAGAGVYVLTVAPAQQGEGLAQVSGLGNQAASCNVALTAEALTFRLIRLAVDTSVLADTAHLRNRVAASCFGYDAITVALDDPFAEPATAYGTIDTLRAQTMSDQELPLAVIGWSVDAGIQFVDLWSVRRRITAPLPEGDWASFVAARRRAEAEATFLQFQQQIGDLVAAGSPGELVLGDSFERLPPVGVLPLTGQDPGIDIGTFFGVCTTRGPIVIESARVEPLIRQAITYAPVDPTAGNLIWLYQVHENLDPGSTLVAPGDPYLLFTSGFVPYAGDAQYALAYWNYANYSLHAH